MNEPDYALLQLPPESPQVTSANLTRPKQPQQPNFTGNTQGENTQQMFYI